MGKIKVLFLVTEFWQAGGQRYTYEIDSALDKQKFESSFLSFRDLNTNPEWPDYYYKKHIELGSNIYFYSSLDPENILLGASSRRNWIKERSAYKAVNRFLNKFEVILLQGEWVYNKFQNIFDESNFKKVQVSILNSVYQFPDNYKGFNKSKNYSFISGYPEGALKKELADFSTYKHHFFPLCINLKQEFKWSPESLSSKRIGVFTRLTKTKPIEPLLYAFSILHSYDNDFELYIFGNGDPNEVGYSDHLNYLGIADKVFFKGHQDDIIVSSIESNIGVAWFLGIHGLPAGFAGYDISSIGLPQLFWDLKPSDKSKSEIIPMFNSLLGLANKTKELFDDNELAIELSLKQQDYDKENVDIRSFIKEYEANLIEVSKGK